MRVETNKAEIYTFDDFLSHEECDKIIEYISLKSKRSTVSSGKEGKVTVSSYRTSSTSSIKHQDFPLIKEVDKRISRKINVPLELGEVIQGQLYEVGQEFKDHTDYFPEEAIKNDPKARNWGNRTWTFMIYLNDDCEGGETEFKKIGIKFTPKKGMALAWRNKDKDGKLNPNTLHAGRPVKKGIKYIITKWFRERPTGVYLLSGNFKQKYKHLVPESKPLILQAAPIPTAMPGKVFTSHKDFPKFTEKGFLLMDVPEDIWKVIQDTYHKLLPKIRPEKFPRQISIIYDKEKKESPVDIIDLGYDKPAKEKIHKMLLPLMKEWSGENITQSMMYGIRSYKKGAILVDHKDRLQTHHISVIIIVDEDSNKPWPLDIQDHDGTWHKVYAKPGQMILYESCACQHGRLEEFDGNFFRNMFVHYQLQNWTYVPNVREKAATTT